MATLRDLFHCFQIFVEFKNHEATAFTVEIANYIVLSLVEIVIIKSFRLVLENLLSICVDWGHNGLFFRAEVVVVEVFVFHIKNKRADSLTGIPLPLDFENHHSVVKSASEVVEGGVST